MWKVTGMQRSFSSHPTRNIMPPAPQPVQAASSSFLRHRPQVLASTKPVPVARSMNFAAAALSGGDQPPKLASMTKSAFVARSMTRGTSPAAPSQYQSPEVASTTNPAPEARSATRAAAAPPSCDQSPDVQQLSLTFPT